MRTKLKFCLFFLVLVPGLFQPLWAYTLAQLRTEIRRNVNDVADPSIRYSDEMLTKLLNEGQRDVVNQTWCLDATTSTHLEKGTTFYDLPSDFIAAQLVQFKDASNTNYLLEEKNEKSFIANNPDWLKGSGKPVNYFVRSSTTSTDLTYEMAIYPIPATDASTGTVTMDYFKQATDMSASTDVPFDGVKFIYPYHEALIFYVIARIKTMEGNANDATFFLQLYTNALKTMMSRLGARPNWNPSFSVEPK